MNTMFCDDEGCYEYRLLVGSLVVFTTSRRPGVQLSCRFCTEFTIKNSGTFQFEVASRQSTRQRARQTK